MKANKIKQINLKSLQTIIALALSLLTGMLIAGASGAQFVSAEITQQPAAVCFSSDDGKKASDAQSCFDLAGNGKSRPVFQDTKGKSVDAAKVKDGACYLEINAHTYKEQSDSKCTTLKNQVDAANPPAGGGSTTSSNCALTKTGADGKSVPKTNAELEAAGCSDTASCTDSGLAEKGCGLIDKYINPLIKFLSISIGVLGAIGLVYAGIEYSMASGDPGKVAKAKNRIVQIIIGLVIFMLFTTILRLLIPGLSSGSIGN